MNTKEETLETTAPLIPAERLAFIRLPIEERRTLLEEQAEAMIADYELEANRRERELWQGGDIVEY
jgi:hypothetical protein